MRKQRIIYHSDPDGYCSAWIVQKYLIERGFEEISYSPINYGQPTPEINDERVYMVDFCLQPASDMADFAKKLGPDLIWIDHHKTAVQARQEFQVLREVAGSVIEKIDGVPQAGCELTWHFLFPGEKPPRFVSLVGEYDTWRHAENPESKAVQFQYGIKTSTLDPQEPEGSAFWKSLEVFPEIITRVIESGRKIEKYQKNEDEDKMKAAFEGEFAGYPAIIYNGLARSLTFDSVYDAEKHRLMVSFYLNEGEFWTVGLYSEDPKIDCGQLAKKLGAEGPIGTGGGHPGAAGFQTQWDHLQKLIKR